MLFSTCERGLGIDWATVCLFARFQEEGYDQTVNVPETIQVGLCHCVKVTTVVLTRLPGLGTSLISKPMEPFKKGWYSFLLLAIQDEGN